MIEINNSVKVNANEFTSLINERTLDMTCKHFEAMIECASKGTINYLKGEGIYNKEILNSTRSIVDAFLMAVASTIYNNYRADNKTDTITIFSNNYISCILSVYKYFVDNSNMKKASDYEAVVGLLHITINQLLELTCPEYLFKDGNFGIAKDNVFYYA